jgi:predicted transcriptional regulator of viral defense system
LNREERWKLRLQDARAAIAEALPDQAYTEGELERVLTAHRAAWRFPGTLHVDFFLDYLVKTRLLRRVTLTLDDEDTSNQYPTTIRLYAKLEATPQHIALKTRKNAFLSHLSAAHAHGLTNIVPRQVFTNEEQSQKPTPRASALTQSAIDTAFAKPARTTARVYKFDEFELVFATGKFTGNLDVTLQNAADGNAYPTTSLERTLIECAVRPPYSGGIHEVVDLYVAAKERLSLRRLRKILDDLNFTYPYRQSVGFLLERSGYPPERLTLFESPRFEYDFYLDYVMPNRAYSSRWRLYYPEGM